MESKVTREQREILAQIDAILTMAEKMPESNIGNLNIAANPFDFLFTLINRFVSVDEIIDFLSKIIITSIVPLELSLKTVLISKIKQRIDCNSDPRIPNWMRKSVSEDANENFGGKINKGIVYPLYKLDYTHMLQVSPMSKQGNYLYFGTRKYYTVDDDRLKDKKYPSYANAVRAMIKAGITSEQFTQLTKDNVTIPIIHEHSEISNVYELARAEDFNAFLWFVMNKTYFPLASNNRQIFNKKNINVLDCSSYIIDENNKTSNGIIKDEDCRIFPGESLYDNDAKDNIIPPNKCLCIKYEDVENEGKVTSIVDKYNPKKIKVTLVPISSDEKSVNWYINKNNFLTNTVGNTDNKKEARDYSKEVAICNLKYMNRVNGIDKNNKSYVIDNCISFTILPKPFVYVPKSKDPMWGFMRILFDKNGNKSKKGKYSVYIPKTNNDLGDYIENEDVYRYKTVNENIFLDIDPKRRDFHLTFKDDSVSDVEKNKQISTVLYECYPGLTVYEFNFDFIMSMKLFDPVVIAGRIVEMISSLRYYKAGYKLSINKTESAYQARISKIVEDIVNSKSYDAYMVSDCFYTFDNAKYQKMLNDAELKRAHLYPFNKNGNMKASNANVNNAYDILNEYDENATFEENKDVIKRTLKAVNVDVTEEIMPEDSISISKGFMLDILKSLVNILTDVVLTPKILMTLAVNKSLLGSSSFITDSDTEDLLRAFEDIIIAVIAEIRDIILSELLSWVGSLLSKMLNTLGDIIIREQLEYYNRLMSLLLNACSFKIPHRKLLDSDLDNVDYADIDPIDKPIDNNCEK